MPFTFAHPLYSFPIKFIKPRYFSLLGLILGSMSPDFEYFIALEPYQTIGHTFKGLLLQAIPICIVMVILLQIIMKVITVHLPSFLHIDVIAYCSIKHFDLRNRKNWIVFLLSVVIGFYSHVFVDSFTHQSGYFVRNFTVLQHLYVSVPLYKLLQHLLSTLGILVQMLLLLFLIIKSPYTKRSFKRVGLKSKIMYWLVVILVTIVVVITKVVLTSSSNLLGILVVSPISGFILGLIVSSLIFRKRVVMRRLFPLT